MALILRAASRVFEKRSNTPKQCCFLFRLHPYRTSYFFHASINILLTLPSVPSTTIGSATNLYINYNSLISQVELAGLSTVFTLWVSGYSISMIQHILSFSNNTTDGFLFYMPFLEWFTKSHSIIALLFSIGLSGFGITILFLLEVYNCS